jgi:hypothetical protein
MTSKPPSTDRCGRWREEMSPAERTEFERVAGELLTDLGYETLNTPADAPFGKEKLT